MSSPSAGRWTACSSGSCCRKVGRAPWVLSSRSQQALNACLQLYLWRFSHGHYPWRLAFPLPLSPLLFLS